MEKSRYLESTFGNVTYNWNYSNIYKVKYGFLNVTKCVVIVFRMFAAVATNILKCMFTYLGVLFAFSLTLHFLFRTQKDFDSVGFTFLKVVQKNSFEFP